MRIVLVGFLAFAFTVGPLAAGENDLGAAYYHFTLARIYSQDKRFAEAIEELKKAVELDPNSSDLRVQYALTLYEASYIRDFVAQCEKAIELDPSNPEPHFVLGKYYFTYREGNFPNMLDKAQASFERVIELDPKHVSALDFLSRVYIMREEWSKAADTLGRLLDASPSYSNGYYLRALALVRLDKQKEAIQVLEAAVKYDAAEVEHLKLLGGLYLDTPGRAADAVNVLQKAVEMDQQNEDPEIRVGLAKALKATRKFPQALDLLKSVAQPGSEAEFEATFELADTLSRMGRDREAAEDYRRLLDMEQVKQNPSNLNVVRIRLTLAYIAIRDYDNAVAIARQVRDSDSQNPDNLVPLVQALKEAGKPEQALQLVDQALAKWPDHGDLIVAKAQLLSASGQTDKGVEFVSDSVLKTSDPERALLVASQLYVDDKKYEQAEKLIKQGLEKLPDNENLQFQLGAVYERQEKYNNAEATFRKVLTRNPTHDAVLNYLGYMLAERGVRLEEALAYVQKAVELMPYNGAYLDSLGWVYFKLKQYDQAEINLKEAAELIDDDPTILEHLGDLYRKLDRYDEAGRFYEKSVANSKEPEEHKRVQSKLSSVKKLLSERRQ